MAPAGDNRCPVCRAALWAPDSETIGRRDCPRCGAELWALVGSDGPMFFLRRPGESECCFLAALVGRLDGVSAEEMEVGLKTADRLDLVEIVMEVEEAIRSGRC
ncbi:MAG TPA: hypothetical protein VKE74_18980 [Gemmataceae bacterium]|nr:hypothetical protein [Gemmataceae bacterium]